MQTDSIGVIFDMDGVLVASGPAHDAAWRATARKHGLNITSEQFRATFGRPSRDIVRLLWNRTLTDAEIRAIDEEKEALYRELVTGMVPLTIGVRETLHGLREARVPLAVATSAPPANLELVLREKDLGPLFHALVTGDDIQHGKPAPDCFLLAAERLQLPASRCVVVEDAPVGIQAARAAGMAVIGFVGTYPAEKLREAGATHVARQLTEVTPALAKELSALQA